MCKFLNNGKYSNELLMEISKLFNIINNYNFENIEDVCCLDLIAVFKLLIHFNKKFKTIDKDSYIEEYFNLLNKEISDILNRGFLLFSEYQCTLKEQIVIIINYFESFQSMTTKIINKL